MIKIAMIEMKIKSLKIPLPDNYNWPKAPSWKKLNNMAISNLKEEGLYEKFDSFKSKLHDFDESKFESTESNEFYRITKQ